MASNAVEVYIKLPSGRSAKYDILASQCVSALCEMVSKEERVDCKHVRLKYQGKALQGTKTVKEYGIRVETILKAEFLVPKAIDFSVQLPEGGVDGIECSNLDPVSLLFAQVAEKTGLPRHRLALTSGSKDLKPSSVSILDYGIEPGSLITVSVKAEEEKKIHVQHFDKEETMEEEDKMDILTSFNTDGKRVDIVFSFDTTGSMYSYLTEVRSKLQSCCTRLLEDIPGIRIGLIAHGDYCDQNGPYVLRSADLTDSVDTLLRFAKDVPSTSGGDAPECYEWVLRKAQYMDWSEDSAKALVVIGDLYPHPPSYTDQNIKWRDELDVLKGMGVKVYGVQAGRNQQASNFYAEISEVSGGKHLNLKHFGIITDMFLAVCYREGDEEKLEEFEQELQAAGNMTEEKKEMFVQLKEKEDSKDTAEATPQRHVAEPWWDHTLDTSPIHQYMYDAEKDSWERNRSWETPSSNTVSYTTPVNFGKRKRKGKGKCSLM